MSEQKKKIDEKSQKIINFYSGKIRDLRIIPVGSFEKGDISSEIKELEEKYQAERERDLTTGAILEKTKDLLDEKCYRKLLREVGITSKEATKAINNYVVFSEAVSSGISEIHILRMKKRDLSDIFYIPKGQKKPSVYVAIEYDEEDRLHTLIDQALEKFHEDEKLLEKIKKNISYRGRSVK